MKRRPVTIAVLLMLGLGVAGLVWRSAPNPIIRTTSLGEEAFGVAVDQVTNRAFVITNLFFPASEPQGHVAVLDTRSGRLLRTLAVGMNPNGVVVAARAGRVYVSNQDDTLSVLDAWDGRLLNTIHLDLYSPLGVATQTCTPRGLAVDERSRRLFIACDGSGTVSSTAPGLLRILDLRSGRFMRTTPLPPAPMAVAVDELTERVFVADAGGAVSTLDARSGRLLRTTRVGKNPLALAVDERTAHIFVANGNDVTVSMLDARSGRLRRTITVGSGPGALAADAAAGRIVVNEGGDKVSVLDATTGTILHTVTLPSGLVLGYQDIAVDARTGRIFVATGYQLDHALRISGPGNLVVLDGATATIRRMVPFGYIPTGVAVDEQAGSVVVVDAGDQFRRGRPDAWSWVPSWLRPWLPSLPAPAPGTGAMPGTVTVLDTSRL